MSVHLTVIAYPSAMQSSFEVVAMRARPTQKHRFVRCQRPGQLRHALANVAAPIALLDLYGHGAPGRLELGDGMLLDGSDAAIRRLREVVDPYLLPHAPIRLLGCSTAEGATGQVALRRLARLLGRQVFGTSRPTQATHFGAQGLRARVARSLLVGALPPADR